MFYRRRKADEEAPRSRRRGAGGTRGFLVSAVAVSHDSTPEGQHR